MEILTGCNLAQIIVDILDGKTVVFPTETSYGLGCDATNQTAVDKIFKIKGRPGDKPLLVVVPNIEMAKKYLVWNDTVEKIANKYWPGPVTVVGRTVVSPPFKEGSASRPGEVKDMRMIAFNKTLDKRKELRKNKTEAEKILWYHLNNKKLGGLKFRRQHGIGNYIVDFYQPDSKTIVEVDGDVHFSIEETAEKDKKKEAWFRSMGYSVLRINNVDVFNNLEDVLSHIYHNVTLALTSPRPLLKSRGDELASGVVSKDNTVAVRVSAYPLLKSITEKFGRPLVATSANISDTGDMYSAAEIVKQFQDKINQPDIILDYGELPRQAPTTIVSVVGNKLTILRQGEVKIA